MSYGTDGGRSRSSSFKMRLIIALVIAGIAFMSYLAKSSVNPTTGETQRVGMSQEQEIALGLQAAPEMSQQHGGEVRAGGEARRVQQVGQRLLEGLEKSLTDGQTNPYPFKFHLLADDRTINAFALPGGQVFITMALYEKLETEGQLAGVLGHEIGHVLDRHGAQQMAKQELTQGLVGAAGMAGGTVDSARMAQFVGQFVNLKYGRDDELKADRWGVKLTGMSGYDPRAMLGVMKVLDEASQGGSPPEMMSTHPKPANRAEYIERVIQEVWPQGVPAGLEP